MRAVLPVGPAARVASGASRAAGTAPCPAGGRSLRAPCSPFYGGDVRHEVSRTCRSASLQRRRFWKEIHMTTTMHDGLDLDQIPELAAQLRVDSVRSSSSAGSGHPTSSMSAADLLATLMARHLRYDWEDRKSTRLNSSHVAISYAVFCLKN